MGRFPIGVIIDSFRTDIPTAVKKAAEVGAQGIQVYATRGEMAPENMNAQRIADFKALVADNGLVISALCGDLGGGFGNKEENPGKVERSKKILDLAKELGTNVVTTHIGVVPTDSSIDRYKVMQEACFELSRYADEIGAHFAIETGPETSAVLKCFLDSLGSTGVGVNLDPANLVMVTGDDPAGAVYNLQKYIVHTHAKDGKQLYYKDPEIIYGLVKDSLVTGPSFLEVPLGEGQVPWEKYLNALEDIGYKGFLTIEREVGDDPAKDIRSAVEFLEKLG
ncbi:MAG: sugar phosphate isomerase/epimerase family protein [Oscillospiraceae bacterium]|nr:sugar phosphate isomerase/epimerase family protein [Oscillospiraceae bacterium]CDC12056.1 xylose isomerase domain-containing protein TIM barrel [Clostridium sp. CAG:413]